MEFKKMKTILLIEDEETLRESVREMLGFEGYKVIEANNGIDGIHVALNEFPDMILCDIMLPCRNGFEVFKEVKSHPEMTFVPFIFLTAMADEKDIRKGMGLGADDYVTKPFKRDDLINTIKARFDKSEIFNRKNELTGKSGSSHQDLDDFLHFISHELKNPLIVLNMFSQLLMEDYLDRLDKKGQEYLETINSYVKRMNIQVEEFLYSSIQKPPEQKENDKT